MRFFGKWGKKTAFHKLRSKELLLISLYSLEGEGYKPIDESRLHSSIYFLKSSLPFPYNFLNKPIVFSYDLRRDVEELRSDGYVEVIIEVINESVPRYSYKLTLIGRVKAENLLNSLPTTQREILKKNVRDIAVKVKL